MSRKHYRAVADVIASAREGVQCSDGYETLRQVTEGLADVFKRDNMAFGYQKFYDACGIDPSDRHLGRR